MDAGKGSSRDMILGECRRGNRGKKKEGRGIGKEKMNQTL